MRRQLYKVRTNSNNTVIVKARQEELETLYQEDRIKEYGLLRVYKVAEV